VVGHRKALHAQARRAILQHLVEGRDALGRNPAIRLVEGKEAGHIRLDHGDQA
jgi:hypothetical protein